MNKKKNSKQVFKEDYFKEYYHDLTGDFEQKDLKKMFLLQQLTL